MKKTVIQVTRSDIDRGNEQNPSSCPIALALKRTFVIQRVHVGIGGSIQVGSVACRGGSAAALFVRAFDHGGYANRSRMKPFSFTLELEDPRQCSLPALKRKRKPRAKKQEPRVRLVDILPQKELVPA